MSLAGLLLSLTYRQVGHGVMSSSLSEAATYEPERKYLEKRRGKLFSFLQAAGLSRFFTFFCENLRAVWVVRLTVIVCFFFRAPSVPFIATRGSSSVEETQAAVFIMLTRLQWKGWQRSQKETDTSAVTWNTHTHTQSLTGCIKGRLQCFVVQ